MDNIVVWEIAIDLTNTFFRSSQDALKRAKQFAGTKDSQNTLYISADNQAIIETCIMAFLTIEAMINRLFHNQIKLKQNLSPFDKWLKSKWQYNLRVDDKITLMLHEYTKTDFLSFPNLREIFLEFVSFRNGFVHAIPQEYELLGQLLFEEAGVERVSVEATHTKVEQNEKYPRTKFSIGIWSLNYSDAAKSFEIMLLMLSFLIARFRHPFGLWLNSPDDNAKKFPVIKSPEFVIRNLPKRFFSQINPGDFVISEEQKND